MKKIFILMALFIIIFSSCNTFSYVKEDFSELKRIISITEEYKGSATLAVKYWGMTITNDEDKKNVYKLYCKIYGKVENIVEIEFTNNEGTVSYKIVPENGKIKFIYNTDWYSNKFVIKFIYNNIPDGDINIKYKFM
jgi:hypothetical protein